MAALLGVAFLAPVGLAAQADTTTRGLREIELEDGLHVIAAPDRAIPMATVLLAVKSGAFTQEPSEEGMAHMYEHLLFHSFKGNPNAFGIEASDLDASYNGSTSYEMVNYFLVLPAKNATKGIKLLAKLVKEARFTLGDLNTERPVVEDEIDRHASEPSEAFEEQVEQRLWGDTWYRKNTGGDRTSLRGITINRLQDTYERYYVPNNAALIVSGDINPDDVFEAARGAFKGWKRAPDPFVDHPVPPMTELMASSAVVMSKDVYEVTILVELQGPSAVRDTAATYAADVLFDILNDPGSRFHQRLVDHGAFLSLNGSYLTLNHVGPIRIEGHTTPENAQEALLSLLDALDDPDILVQVDEEDLEAAKRRREVAHALRMEEAAMAAPDLAFWWTTVGMEYYEGYAERMNRQTLADLRQFVNRYLVNRPRVIGILAPPETVQGIAEWLRQQTGAQVHHQ